MCRKSLRKSGPKSLPEHYTAQFVWKLVYHTMQIGQPWNLKLHRTPQPQKTLDPRHRLTYPLIVLHQRKPDMAFTMRPEADSGRHGHQRLVDQTLGKLPRPQVPVSL